MSNSQIKIALVSLGCDKNLVDSEVMLGLCKKEGFDIMFDESRADIIVINTCSFIQDALEESIETIIEMGKYKETGNCKGLIIAGCLGQRYQDEIFKELPEVDAILGTTAYEDIAAAAKEVFSGKKVQKLPSIDLPMAQEEHSYSRLLSGAGYLAYLKISEGCDNHCTYCVIPKLRGKYRSRRIESLVQEAIILAKQGVKELILVAQDTAIYGKDLYGESCLDQLLKELCTVEGIEWIRILYAYPEHLTDKTIQVMAQEKKICHYLDMPIQHGCDSVLKRMGRSSTVEMMREKISTMRAFMPDIIIRTTIITGFPGETKEEFNQCADFIQEIAFDRLGVFTYSKEADTPAAIMENQVDEDIKIQRKDILMDIQKGISAKNNEKVIGSVLQVIIEGKLPEEAVYCGRSSKDAPEIDGLVFVTSEEELRSGDFVDVIITEASDYDLYGRVYIQ